MNTSQNPSPDESRLDFGRVLPLLALVVVLIFGGYAYFNSRIEKQKADGALAEQTQANNELQQQMANLQATMSDLQTAKVYEQQAQSISAANAMSIIERGQILETDIQNFDSLQAKLSETITELKSSDAGRRIASNEKLVAQVHASLSTTLPRDNAAQGLSSRLASLMVAPKQALEEKVSGYEPSSQLLEAVAAIDNETNQSSSTLQRVLDDLQAISKEAAGLPTNSKQTLEQALAMVGSELKEEQREMMADVIAKTDRENAKKIAAAEAENRKRIANAEIAAKNIIGDEALKKIEAETKAAEERIKAAKQRRDAALAEEQLLREYEADLPEIKRYLTAFISDGRKLRNSGSGPASLSYLDSKGALIDNDKGLEQLLSLGVYYNDRPSGALPEFFYFNSVNLENKNAKIAAIEKAQQFLIKYGVLMTENGTLAK